MPVEIVLRRLSKVTGVRPTWAARCPAHSDLNPSLSVTEGARGVLLIHCHRGCSPEAVMAAIGLDMTFLYPSPFALRSPGRSAGPCVGREADTFGAPVAEPAIDYARFEALLRSAAVDWPTLAALAHELGLPRRSLRSLCVGYQPAAGRWVFPERDGKRRVVGITYRGPDGVKRCEPDGRRGLFIPRDIDGSRGTLYLAEGPTDTAALHSVGVAAVGRACARASRLARQWAVQLLRTFGDRPVVVVGDRDGAKGGVQPGQGGAQALAAFLTTELGRPVPWALPRPGFKDVREQVLANAWSAGLCVREGN